MTLKAHNLKDVAIRAGVSTSTVSRVLADKTYVQESTRLKVLKAVQEMDYHPNSMAKGLKLGRSNAIALMIPSIDNLIFPSIVRGVEDYARSHNFFVTLCNTDENINVEKRYIQKLCNMGVDGIIVATMRKDSDHIVKLHREGFPVVLTSRNFDSSLDAVVIDNRLSAYTAVSFLLSRGYRRIAVAIGDISLPLYARRLQGYRDALLEYGIPFDEDLILYEVGSSDSFYPLVTNLLKKDPSVDSIFASSDIRAIVSIRAIRDTGRTVPKDIAVMGFDDVPISVLVDPPLTTTRQPFYEMGVLAAKRLIEQIQFKQEHGTLDEPKVNIMKTELVVRSSTL
jgi:LacI family transcriptional regulator